jgi:translation initiation factor 1 (eIF-1/SUI1)
MLFIVWGAMAIVIAVSMATSCTVSFNNIRTQGEASDVVDETLRTDPTTNPTITASLPFPTAKITGPVKN